MLDSHHLSLRSVQLPRGAEWSLRDEGLLFVFPQGGRGHCACGSVTHAMDGGDVMVVNGTAGAVLSVAGGPEFSFAWFALRLEHLFPLFGSAEILVLQSLADGFKVPRRYPNGTDLTAKCQQWLGEVPPECNLIHRGSLLRVASAVLSAEVDRARAAQVSPGATAADEHFFATFARLSVEEFMAMGVDELAARFRCGRRHLNRLFQRNLGHSVGGLRMELRLIKAAALLRSPDAKVINVAADCGFHHLGLFNTCFKRRFGQSPGQWRKSLIASTPGPVPGSDLALEPQLGGNGSSASESPTCGGKGVPAVPGWPAAGPAASNILQWKAAEFVGSGGEGNRRERRVAGGSRP